MFYAADHLVKHGGFVAGLPSNEHIGYPLGNELKGLCEISVKEQTFSIVPEIYVVLLCITLDFCENIVYVLVCLFLDLWSDDRVCDGCPGSKIVVQEVHEILLTDTVAIFYIYQPVGNPGLVLIAA